ncbi:MAG: MotA/TolQ/ExbB proton channel family protein [Planctomycetaceae bacterium]
MERPTSRRFVTPLVCGLLVLLFAAPADAAEAANILTEDGVDIRALLRAGGIIGYVILALSVAMVALIVEHLLSIRRSSMMPLRLIEESHQLITSGQLQNAEQLCRQQSSFVGYVVAAGLQEVSLGYPAVEKAMEDAATEQSARLFRKIEYLSVIGTLAPMLGLMGTVWGMIQAFGEFSAKANPQVAEFAPGISHALVTTLMGLCVAVPALGAFALFRNRIDEMVAESSLAAEHVMSPLKRALIERKKTSRDPRSNPSGSPSTAGASSGERTAIPPVAIERERPS